jgi:hypothetical protein
MLNSLQKRSLLVCVLFLIISCTGPVNAIIGKWEDATGYLAFEFFESGTMLMTLDGREFSGTYEMPQDDQVRTIISGDFGPRETLLTNVEIVEDKLSFVLGGDSYEMFRVESSTNVSP